VTTEADQVASVASPRFHVCGQATTPAQLEANRPARLLEVTNDLLRDIQNARIRSLGQLVHVGGEAGSAELHQDQRQLFMVRAEPPDAAFLRVLTEKAGSDIGIERLLPAWSFRRARSSVVRRRENGGAVFRLAWAVLGETACQRHLLSPTRRAHDFPNSWRQLIDLRRETL